MEVANLISEFLKNCNEANVANVSPIEAKCNYCKFGSFHEGLIFTKIRMYEVL